MATLQKVNLGTPPTAVDGDTVRGANTKANENVDVLNSQAALVSAAATITTAQALTAAHVGKRVNINLAAAGTINLPSAATMGLDGVVHLRNVGTTLVTLAVAAGSGDTISLTKLYGGESALFDSDGTHAIGCLIRGRSTADNETVIGNSTVNGNETVGGTLSVTGASSFGSTGQAAISAAGAYSGPSLTVTGASAFGVRPTFNGNTPYDSGNFNPASYAPLNAPSFTGPVLVGGTAWTAANLSVRNSAAATWVVSAYASTQSGGCFIGRTDSGSVPLAAWFFGTNGVGSITTNGSSTTYGTASDYRLKDGVEDIDGSFAVDLVKKGRPRRFWMKTDPERRVNFGFLAHEYAEIQPEAVVGDKDAVGPAMQSPGEIANESETVPLYQHMDYSKPTPILWAALKQALAMIESLNEEVAALKESR